MEALDQITQSLQAIEERTAKIGDLEKRLHGVETKTNRPGMSAAKGWDGLLENFEMKQIAAHLDEGKALTGQTAEVVQEMKAGGGYRGTPIPWAALERKSTVAATVMNPITTANVIDRLFPDSVAARMGAAMVPVGAGLLEYPVTNSSITAGWAATESGNVAGPTAYTTVDRPLAPNQTLGIRVAVSRRAMLQAGDALEEAIRRDLAGAVQQALDQAVFLGTGASGQPLGVVAGAATYGITSTAVGAGATWAAFRAAVVRFMTANAAGSPGDVRLLIRPEVYGRMDNTLLASTAVSEWDRLAANIPAENIAMSANALAAPVTNNVNCLLTTTAGGVPPIFIGAWGGMDLVRDPYSDAASGGLRLTALATIDVTISRAAQLEVLTGVSVV